MKRSYHSVIKTRPSIKCLGAMNIYMYTYIAFLDTMVRMMAVGSFVDHQVPDGY